MKDVKLLKENVEYIISEPGFEAKFTGKNSHDQAMWMNEARAYLVKCVGKLDKVLEVEK